MQLVLKLAVSSLIFAIGMNLVVDEFFYLLRRPGLLLRSLLAMYVITPLVAVLLVRGLDLPSGTEVGIVLLAICAGAPLLPRKLIELGGDPSYVFSLVLLTSLLAIVTIPVSVELLGPYLPPEVDVTPGEVAATLLRSFLAPLGLGMAVRALFPGFAARVADPILRVAGAALAVCAIALLVLGWRKLADVGLPSMLAFAAFTLATLLTGHLLGGPDPSQRTSLAVSCATRHIGLALLMAAEVRGPRALSLVIGYLLAAALVSIPYVQWRRRVLAPT